MAWFFPIPEPTEPDKIPVEVSDRKFQTYRGGVPDDVIARTRRPTVLTPYQWRCLLRSVPNQYPMRWRRHFVGCHGDGQKTMGTSKAHNSGTNENGKFIIAALSYIFHRD